jgi:hypothetical protein
MKTCIAAVGWLFLLGTLWAQTESRAQKASVGQQPDKQTALSTSAQIKVDPAKEAGIRRLMDLAGAKTLASQMMEAMGKNIKPLMTNALPAGEYREKLIDLFFAKFQSKAEIQKLLDLIVPVYDKYLSDEEIKGLIQFYQTPLGQKTLRVMPQLMAESQEEGRKWGEGLGRQSMLDVLSEHPELEKALEDAQKAAQTH